MKKQIDKAMKKATGFFDKFGYMDLTRFRMFFDGVTFNDREQEINVTLQAYFDFLDFLIKSGRVKEIHTSI